MSQCFLSTGEAGKRRASQMRNRTITIKSVNSVKKKNIKSLEVLQIYWDDKKNTHYVQQQSN